MTDLWRVLLLVLFASLAGCGPRAGVDLVTAKPETGTDIDILVGTTREIDATGQFSQAGRGSLTYARFIVSVPPDHLPGAVEVAGRVPDPATDFVTRDRQILGSSAAFQRDVSRALRQSPDARGEVIVFVHGFNNTLGDGIYRLAQMVNDMGTTGVPTHFSWPSAANPLGYVRDRDSALASRAAFITMLDDIARSGARRIVIVAHSMGSFLTLESLVWMAKSGGHPGFNRIGGVILLSPDIDVDLFQAQAAEIGTLPQPFVIFTNARDRALNLSARLTGEQNRLGTLTSPDDVANLEVTLIDVTALDDVGSSHLAAVSSPTMLRVLSQARAVDAAFGGDPSGRLGLIPGTIVTVRNATELIVSPVDALASALN